MYDDVRPLALFNGVSDEQLRDLLASAEECRLEPGEELFREGEPAERWCVLLDGAFDLIRHVGREDLVLGRMDVPGRWAGGFRAWDESAGYLATARCVEPARVMCVPAQQLRELMGSWFPFGVHMINGLYGTARSIESNARQRDSLVTLGTLAAGLAHEINNPAAAATRGVQALDDNSRSLLDALSRLAKGEISAQQFLDLEGLRREIVVPERGSVSALDLADREEELGDWLERHDVDHAWTLASALAADGVDVAWCDRAHALLGDRALQPGMEWVAGTLSMSNLLAEVRDATSRISELVASVRSYTQLDRASAQQVDVTEGLESTLVMLGHKLRDGVEVVREYAAGLPTVDGFPGELNQVWTNAIDNAIDAMDGQGRLRLTARPDGPGVLVEVADTGHGVTPEVAARAFDAFYTTKEVGKGTGLGLDIARRIVVERHGGTIELVREGDETVLRVRLPA